MREERKQPSYHYSVQFRAIVLCAGFVTLLTGLSVRLIHVQHTCHEEMVRLTEEEVYRKVIIPARRGDISDRDRRPLATTHPVSALVLDKYKTPSTAEIHRIASQQAHWTTADLNQLTAAKTVDIYYRMLAHRLAVPLQRDMGDLYKRLIRKNKDLIIQKDIDSEVAHRLVEELEEEGFSGLRCEDSMNRSYVSETLACHVLGFVDARLHGQSGIELGMNDFLHGTNGSRLYDLHGQVVEENAPEDGRHVVLTIDSTFQAIAEEVMDRHYQALRPEAMTAIFAEPSSGEILALVNRPGFNPADGGNADKKSQWNTAVASVYEPGSTFKIVTLGSALDQDLVRMDTVVNCHNGYYAKLDLKDASRGRPSATVRDVLAYSLNTGTYMVAQQMKPSSYYTYMGNFGLGKKTGIRLPAEAKGFIPHPNHGWGRKPKQLSRLGMGYTLNASPLQILGFMNVVCNGGDLVKHRIVRHIVSAKDQQVTAEMPREVAERVISPRTAASLKSALVHAVENGTGRRVQIPGYVVGGKSGTAGKVINGRYINNRNIVSFLGFIGDEIDVALIGIVLVDDPQNEGRRHGGSVAGPIFKEIAEAGMLHFGIRRQPEIANTPAP